MMDKDQPPDDIERSASPPSLPDDQHTPARQQAGRDMHALLQRLPRITAAERLSDQDVALLVKALR